MRFSKDTVDQFFSHGVHLPSRTLYVGDSETSEISPQTSATFVKGLHLLQAVSKDSVRVLLQTIGGCSVSGMAIYDAIAQCECHVSIEVLGGAMSMGAVILQAADERLMHRNATFMLHDGQMGMQANCRDVENWAAWSRESRKRMYEIFAKRTERKPAYWARKCESDCIMDAQQALDEHLIDRIIGS